jgi:hypothetical protein
VRIPGPSALFYLACTLSACADEAVLPEPDPPTVLVVTMQASDPDYPEHGFALTVNGGAPVPFALPTATLVQEVTPAAHQLHFISPDAGCSFVGGSERTVELPAGDTVRVVVNVSCTARFGTVQLDVITSGPDPDVDGYVVGFDVMGAITVASNGSRVIGRVPAGPLVMTELGGLASNCVARTATPDGSHPVPAGREVLVTGAGRTTVTLRVDCHPIVRNRILFHTHVEGGLYSIHPDGHSLVQLAPAGSYVGGEMSLSPDGVKLAWSHGVGRERRNGMTLMYVDGTVIANVFGDREVTHPSWSRDGAVIVADDFTNVLAVNADGSDPRQVRVGREPDLLHAAGPLVFIDGGPWIAPTLTGQASGLLPSHGMAIPRWSPDGGMIAYLALPPGSFGHQLHVMNANGADRRQVTYFPFGMGAPTWSPDGSRIAIGGDNNIWIASVLGAGTLSRMDLPPLASLPLWSLVP